MAFNFLLLTPTMMLLRAAGAQLPRCTWDDHFCTWDDHFVPGTDIFIFPSENLEQNTASPEGGSGLKRHFQIFPVVFGQRPESLGRNAGEPLEIARKVRSLFIAERVRSLFKRRLLRDDPQRILTPPPNQEVLGRGLE